MDFGLKYYKFKHYKGIEAQIHYDWIKHAIITIDNIVVCQVPREEIEKSKSWELIKH